jgi:hypothetical protein
MFIRFVTYVSYIFLIKIIIKINPMNEIATPFYSA